jgi:hypothetical protein
MADALRLATRLDPTAAALKEWLHLYVFDHPTGAVGFVNGAVHGPPREARSRVLGTALLHVPGIGWTGNMEVRGLDESRLSFTSLALETVALTVHPSGTVLASARLPADGLAMRVTATPMSAPIDFERRLPLGPGWISWYVTPRMSVEGQATVRDRRIDLSGASGYQDHNWGRWHWGDDLGWQFGVFLTASPGPAFVFSRATDRAHRQLGKPLLALDGTRGRRTFIGSSVTVDLEMDSALPVRRIPGALAALHSDRATPDVPGTATITADDGRDRATIEFQAEAAAQIIAADPLASGYGFIHEVVGRFRSTGRARGMDLSAEGLGVLEIVD